MARTPSGPGHQFFPGCLAPHDNEHDMTPRTSTNEQAARRTGRALWLVQAVEYALGIAVGAAAINSADKLPLVVASFMLTANAAVVRAPLSAFRWTTPRVHRASGVAVAIVAVVLPLTFDAEASTMIVLVVAGIAQGFLSVRFGHGIRATRT